MLPIKPGVISKIYSSNIFMSNAVGYNNGNEV